MHRIRRFYYQNKEKILKVALIIVLILGVIYFLNSNVIKRNNEEDGYISFEDEAYADEENNIYISKQSAVSGDTVTEKQASKITNTIGKFLQYCKKGNAEEAYNMISNDCKQDRYTTLEKFSEEYVKAKFNEEQSYEVENWMGNTYRISMVKDLLATGDVTNNEKSIEYITIVKQDNEEKLNVQEFIGKKNINKEKTENNVRIKVIEKKVYMDYEIYNFEVENLSNKTVKLDSLEKTGTIYLKDSSGNKYNARMHEIFEEELTIKAKHTFNFSIKFTNTYSEGRDIKSITFENMILDYNKYLKEETEDTYEFIIQLW